MSHFERVGSFLRQSKPVPAARAMENFCVPEVRDGAYVFLDREQFAYHTLNGTAYGVWQLCDGMRTASDIARQLGETMEAVELAVAELGEAGLLQASQDEFDSRMHRRRVLKLAAAGLAGVGLPLVSSITGTEAARQASCSCPDQGGGCLNNNQTCTHSCQCKSGCCCQGPAEHADCSRRGSCEGDNEHCIDDLL